MRTSNKIWTVYLSLFGVLVIVVSVLNVRAFRQAQVPAGTFIEQFIAAGDSIRVVNVTFDPNMQYGKTSCYIFRKANFGRIDADKIFDTRDNLAGNVKIHGDTLYVNNQRGIHMCLPNVEKVIFNGKETVLNSGNFYNCTSWDKQ